MARIKKTVPAISPCIQMRWTIAVGALEDVVKNCVFNWEWPSDLPGSLGREIRRVAQRVGKIEPETLRQVLLLRWESAKPGGNDVALQLIRELELTLARVPRGLLDYLARSRSLPTSSADKVGLLLIALSYTDDEEECDDLRRKIESFRLFEKATRRRPVAVQTTPPLLSPSQARAMEQLQSMARLFFEGAGDVTTLAIRPRNCPLVVGPTGSGKSFLVETVARSFGAYFLKAAVGDWVPLGASGDYKPTLFAILDLVVSNERVVLFLDELDKWGNDVSSSWSRSCQTDVMQILDRAPPFEAYQRATKFDHARDLKSEDLRDLLRRRLWIVGAGTWQSLLRPQTALGFAPRGTSDEEQRRDIAASGVLPDELLARFNPELIVLRYPSGPETAEIFVRSGLLALAESIGEKLNPENHDWSRAGMRSLENIATRLLLRRLALTAPLVGAEPLVTSGQPHVRPRISP